MTSRQRGDLAASEEGPAGVLSHTGPAAETLIYCGVCVCVCVQKRHCLYLFGVCLQRCRGVEGESTSEHIYVCAYVCVFVFVCACVQKRHCYIYIYIFLVGVCSAAWVCR